MGIMQFLGDAGGIYQSIFIIGAFVSFLSSGNDLNQQLLERHFIVNSSYFEGSKIELWLSKYRNVKVRLVEKCIFGTVLRFAYKCLSRSNSSKLARQRLLLGQVEKHLEKTLDIRTILRTQSLILAIIRVLFEPNLFPLLALQRKGRVFDHYENADAASKLIHSSESDSGIAP